MKKTLCIVLLALQACICNAQEGRTWYFGEHAGIRFSTSGSITTLTDGSTGTYTTSSTGAQEGTASICDSSGNLLFYSDGSAVWNKNHTLMVNGDGMMGGISSTQAALILPRPDVSNSYYLFTTDDFYGSPSLAKGFRYSIIDMCLDSGRGAVTKAKNLLLCDTVAEKLTASRVRNERAYWVVIHKFFSDEFRSYKVTAGGVTTMVPSTIGTIHGGSTPSLSRTPEAIGQMKISPDGTKLGLVIGNTVPPLLELYDFNDSDGTVSNPISIPLSTRNSYGYGFEFSHNSRLAYCTMADSVNELLQFDLSVFDSAHVAVSRKVIYKNATACLSGLQIGPDDRIYANSCGTALSVIARPDSVGDSCSFIYGSVSLAGRYAYYASPSFVAGYKYIHSAPHCYDETTTVTAIEKPAMMIYPNPTDGMVTISKQGQWTAVVTDLSGNVLRVVSGADSSMLDLSALASGSYILSLGETRKLFVKM